MGKVLNEAEGKKVRRVIESCKTGEQLENVTNWVARICSDSTQRFLAAQLIAKRWAYFGAVSKSAPFNLDN